MAFGSFDNKSSGSVMSEINMVPLIDVMLVLLVIFIVTAPLLTHSVKLDLPQVSAHENQLKPEKVEFAIDAAGTRYWNGEVVTREQAIERFKIEGARPAGPAARSAFACRSGRALSFRGRNLGRCLQGRFDQDRFHQRTRGSLTDPAPPGGLAGGGGGAYATGRMSPRPRSPCVSSHGPRQVPFTGGQFTVLQGL
ncbi:MAG: hypothetical protein KatS3mg122_1908 [Caldimonas sp.]|nr:MAG: hypothetical protein KatS3mg122_1908 [Caldimonas sp.]